MFGGRRHIGGAAAHRAYRQSCDETVPVQTGFHSVLSYLSDYIALPELWENGGETVNAPWILSRVVLLMSKTSLGRNEIWDMPIGEVFWYCAAFGEQEGAVQIQSDAEQAAIEEALKAKNNG